MTINLKIEVLKVFSFEFSMTSEKKQKETKDEEQAIDLLDATGIKQSS